MRWKRCFAVVLIFAVAMLLATSWASATGRAWIGTNGYQYQYGLELTREIAPGLILGLTAEGTAARHTYFVVMDATASSVTTLRPNIWLSPFISCRYGPWTLTARDQGGPWLTAELRF